MLAFCAGLSSILQKHATAMLLSRVKDTGAHDLLQMYGADLQGMGKHTDMRTCV
jgi:predicted glycosyltransferase